MLNRVTKWFKSISMAKKLMVTFIFLSLLPTVTIGFFSYNLSYNNILEKSIDKSYQTLRTISLDMTREVIDKVNYDLIHMTQDPSIIKLMQMKEPPKKNDYNNYLINQVSKIMFDILANPDTGYIYLYSNYGFETSNSSLINDSINDVSSLP